MLRTKSKGSPAPPTNGETRPMEWEMRPGGMLVQKRTDSEKNPVLAPIVRLRVKYGSVYHQISISSQATFGELKKMLVGPTGLHQEDQKLIYREKERDSKAFLDVCGVKERSKIVVVEDPISQEKRLVELRRIAKLEKASNSISRIGFEVDRLAGQVSALESVIGKGGRVPEKTMCGLIELLMNQLIKLDGIMGEGDVKLQRKMQVKRVQKYVETLDMLKIENKNQVPLANSDDAQPQPSTGHSSAVPERKSTSETVVTTRWEIFDAMPPLVPTSSSSTAIPNNSHVQPKFNWEFFD